MVPFDDKSPFVTSGIRTGTAAVTTRFMKESDMETIVELMDVVLSRSEDEESLAQVKQEVNGMMKRFPLYSTLEKVSG